MSEPVRDPDGLERYLGQLDHEQPEHLPTAEARPCPVPVKPGSHNAAAAYRAGCEDEWIDRMAARYGGEW